MELPQDNQDKSAKTKKISSRVLLFSGKLAAKVRKIRENSDNFRFLGGLDMWLLETPTSSQVQMFASLRHFDALLRHLTNTYEVVQPGCKRFCYGCTGALRWHGLQVFASPFF